jgi:valacyclovir hydrolase
VHSLFGTVQKDFRQVLKWLSKDYRVLAPALRGYADSTPKPRDFPPDFYRRDAEDLLAFIAALDLPSAHLLGYSDGGETALIAAGLEPQRFRSVMTIGAVGFFGPELRPVLQRMSPVGWLDEQEKVLHGIEDPVPVMRQWIRAMKMYLDLGGDVSVSLAPNITAPVLMMLGEKDTLNPINCAQVWLSYARKGRLQRFDCGHAIHDERWPEFQQVVSEFLRDVERA